MRPRVSWEIEKEIEEIRAAGLFRELRTLHSPQGPMVERGGRELINFSSNDYLGLAASDELKAALQEGIDRYGAGSGAARLVCGSLAPHEELEDEIARFKGTEAALSFSSGYAVALGTIPALMGKDDVIILDKLCHASLVDAARLSGATVRVFPHNHLDKLEKLLRGAAEAGSRTLVVTESIFSMDGDAATLREIVELKDRHGAWLMLDEAHAVGVIGPQGRGLAAALGLETRIELQMGTLSKAVGLSGGYLAASRAVISLHANLCASSRAMPVSSDAKSCVEINSSGNAGRLLPQAPSNALLLRVHQTKTHHLPALRGGLRTVRPTLPPSTPSSSVMNPAPWN